mmetsp:Transcript_23753/g.43119  ORF Transcript_23753/g.43119 Transcript_23753/m.43119 type:complete len:124 (-) Transcript_23753:303-674(-)
MDSQCFLANDVTFLASMYFSLCQGAFTSPVFGCLIAAIFSPKFSHEGEIRINVCNNQILAFLAHQITTEIGIKACAVAINTNKNFWYRGWQNSGGRNISASAGEVRQVRHGRGASTNKKIPGK